MNKWLKMGLIALMLTPAIVSADWIARDNGDAWGQVFATGQDDGYGVKFDPGEVGTLYRMEAYIGRHDDDWDGFKVWLYGWDTTFEQPDKPAIAYLGELIGSGDHDGWFELDFPNENWDSIDPFVIALTNNFGDPEVDTIYIDSNGVSGSGLYWYLLSGSWQQSNPDGDLMVHVWFSPSPVESTSLGSIKAVYK